MFGFMMVSSGGAPPPPMFEAGLAYSSGGFDNFDWARVVQKWDFTDQTSSATSAMLLFGHSDHGTFGNFTEALWSGGQDFDGVSSRNPTRYVDKFTYADESISPGTVMLSPFEFGEGDYGHYHGWSTEDTGLHVGSYGAHLYNYAAETWSLTSQVALNTGAIIGTNEFALIAYNAAFQVYTFSTDTVAPASYKMVTFGHDRAFGAQDQAVFVYSGTFYYFSEAYVYGDGTYPTLQSFGFGPGEVPSTGQQATASNAATGLSIQGVRATPSFGAAIDNVAEYSFAAFTWAEAGLMSSARSDVTAVATVPGGLVAPVYAPPGPSTAGCQFLEDGYGDGFGDSDGDPVAYCSIELPGIAFEVNGVFLIAQVMFDLIDGTGNPDYNSLPAAGFTINTPPGWTLIRRDNSDFVTCALYWKYSQDEAEDNGISYFVTTDMNGAEVYAVSAITAYSHVDPNNPIHAHAGTTQIVQRSDPSQIINLSVDAGAYDRVLFFGATTIIADVEDNWPTNPLFPVAINGSCNTYERLALSAGSMGASLVFQGTFGTGNRPMIMQAVSLNRGYSATSTPYPNVGSNSNGQSPGVFIGPPDAATTDTDLLIIAIVVFGTADSLDPASGYSVTTPAGWTLIRRDDSGPVASCLFRKLSTGPSEASTEVFHTFPAGTYYSTNAWAYGGVNTGNPIADHAASSTITGAYDISAPSVTPNASGDRLICFVAVDGLKVFDIQTYPSSMKRRAQGWFFYGFDEVLTSNAPTGVRAFFTDSVDPPPTMIAQSIVIRMDP